ncbi:MAG: MBL fold metallo-hydrolase, partial [Asgard group archaeon]|nr:MBL fold metallo-hydrolase [Asgard group archaeon]
DTFLGPDIMKKIVNYLQEHREQKEIIIFNSHYHWDHHWGNCYFSDSWIISHELCREKIIENGKEELEKYIKFHRGEIKLHPPNIVFKHKMNFIEEDIFFFHSPGHTKDSSSCYDKNDKILFAADNVEIPIPYLNQNPDDLDTYQNTLRNYLDLACKKVIPGHGHISGNELIEKNLIYIESFPEIPQELLKNKNRKMLLHIHFHNLQAHALGYEKRNKKKKAQEFYQKMCDFAEKWAILENQQLEKLKKKLF